MQSWEKMRVLCLYSWRGLDGAFMVEVQFPDQVIPTFYRDIAFRWGYMEKDLELTGYLPECRQAKWDFRDAAPKNIRYVQQNQKS